MVELCGITDFIKYTDASLSRTTLNDKILNKLDQS